MIKRMISLLLALLLVGMLAACGSDDPLTVEDAKAVVLEDMGVKEKDVDSIDVHVTTVDGIACYAVYVSIGEEHMEYLVDGLTGDILAKEEADHGHSH